MLKTSKYRIKNAPVIVAKYFDELEGTDPKLLKMMNDRIKEVETQANFSVNQNMQRL